MKYEDSNVNVVIDLKDLEHFYPGSTLIVLKLNRENGQAIMNPYTPEQFKAIKAYQEKKEAMI